MATSFVFDNKLIKLPGAYSTIKSAIKNPPLQATYGNILIIDNGSGAGYGGGSGISGSLASGLDSIYQFDNIDDFRNFTKGGYWWLLADPLFNPATGQNGVSKIYWAKAATTVAATITISPTGGGYAGGSIVLKVKDEGLIGNGSLSSGTLTKGYGWTLTAGTTDITKYILSFYVGTFKGLHTDSIAYDGIAQISCSPILIAKSPEFANISEAITWVNTDVTFNQYFTVSTSSVTGTGLLSAADLTLYTGTQVATGGTETYSTAALSTVLDSVVSLDYTFILSDKYGVTTPSTDNMKSTENGLMLAHISTQAKFEKFMFVGGGLDVTQFAQATLSSISGAQYFNTDKVVLVHGGVKKVSNLTGTGFRNFDSLYKTAVCLGRTAGLPPQVPLTFKDIAIDGEQHSLKTKEKVQALDAGVLATYWDSDFAKFTVLQDVNTIQQNKNLINPDGTSYSLQLRRITSQINKELIINAKTELLGQKFGVNRNTLSPTFLRDWTVRYLQSKVSTETVDNLIISFPADKVTVVRVQDAYQIKYQFSPNTEIRILLFTGVMID